MLAHLKIRWTPLYNSEGPAQAGMAMVKYLDLKLAGKTEHEYSEFYLSYDNMSVWSKNNHVKMIYFKF